MRPPSRVLALVALVALVAPLALLGSGCNQNVACVFTSGCTTGGNGPIGSAAALPIDGDFIASSQPSVVSFFPSGSDNAGTTPIVIVFSESIQANSLTSALEIVPVDGTGFFGTPIGGARQALVSDGRVLVILPSSALVAGDYIVRLAQDAEILDLTGQALDAEAGAQLGSFTVNVAPPTVPGLVTTFPVNGAANQAETTEIVAVFDRPVVQSSVTRNSFDVQVNGTDPVNDPLPTPIVATGGGAADTRAFLYRRVDSAGVPERFGKDAEVRLILSPAGNPITQTNGGALAPKTITFHTLVFSPPISATFLTDPPDAIGLANLTVGNPEELMVEVQLDAAQPTDVVDLYLFGPDKSIEPNPPLIALLRSQRLAGTAPIDSVTFTREQVAMQTSTSPTSVRFVDGPVTFAFVLRRGEAASPVRLLDFDPDPDTIQDPLLDTTPPTVTNWSGSTGTGEFRSDQRGLALAGVAVENVRSVEVDTPLGDNGPLAPVVGSLPLAVATRSELFLAAPVPLGRLDDGTTTFSAVVRDRAVNPSPALAGDFLQFGAVGPDPFTPGQSIEIQVFDAGTLELLEGARVLVHSDRGNGIDYPFVQVGSTVADGTVTLGTESAPTSVGAIVTVDLDGYDLFTLHGVPSTRLSIPLRPSDEGDAQAQGDVSTSDSSSLAIAGLDLRYDDSRRAVGLARGFKGDTCGPPALGDSLLSCEYGPQPIAPNRLGARSFYAGDFSQIEAGFDPAELLQAFGLLVPLRPAAPDAFQLGLFTLTSVLADAGPTEAAQSVPAFRFRLPPVTGLTGAPDDDSDTTGVLRVGVECLVPGLSGSIAVGPGVSFDLAADLWTVLAAYPGAITAAGSLGRNGSVDTDPFVRVELADQDLNTVGIRPRLSTILAGGTLPEFVALRTPTLTSPIPGANTGGEAFTLALTHAIGDDRTEPGLYRVELLDGANRGWTLWRFDPPGAADVLVRVVDVGDGGGVGLSDGAVDATVEAFAWSSLSATDFLWSDVEHQFELFSHAASISFDKP